MSPPGMLYGEAPPGWRRRAAIHAGWTADETQAVERLLAQGALAEPERHRIAARARDLVLAVRQRTGARGALHDFLREYDLSSREGMILMCLAEALLRIPDADTADRLIRDKLGGGEWQRHLGHSKSLLVNAATFGLLLTGRLVQLDRDEAGSVEQVVGRLVARSGEPAIRAALREAMRILGEQFVLGRTLAEARERAASDRRWRYSFDMLGEAALTHADAERYFNAYLAAITAVDAAPADDVYASDGVSVKLSALHPRVELAHHERLRAELVPRVLELARAARDADVVLTLDAEEAERLEPQLDVFEAVYTDARLRDYEGFGLAVQAYQKRAFDVVEHLAQLAAAHGRRIPVRLVKGAYWDSEIKRAQALGLDGYPVFTRKRATDVSYLACARRLLAAPQAFCCQFASHNAWTVAAVVELARGRRDLDFRTKSRAARQGWRGCGLEFQRLHGMGEALYEALRETEPDIPCRVYAPVGSHKDLLPYLVRRLLENGANTSFVNRVEDETIPVEMLTTDPVEPLRALKQKPHPRIPLPADLYQPQRRNSRGINLADPQVLADFKSRLDKLANRLYLAAPLVSGETHEGERHPVAEPANRETVVGEVAQADDAAADAALEAAAHAAPAWSATAPAERAAILERAADLFEEHSAELMALVVREGGRCIPDALAELREAVDYCRYYAACTRDELAARVLPGPTGESNTLTLHGRGVFACISPWNFPLAIFTGQVVGALAAGNAAIAKPASQTPLAAARAVRLLHQAGVPPEALHLLPGGGAAVGERLVRDERVAGVVFTGSTDTARRIQRLLADRGGPIVPLIAETGGINAMIADSSALPEQLVADALVSAFNSAGQRCSALRVLFVPEEIAPRVLELLAGAMEELAVGDPRWLATDVGPVIDDRARRDLEGYAAALERRARLVHACHLPPECARGSFVAPRVFEVERATLPDREVFGPVLHVARYAAGRLGEVVEAINATGYGLTLGVHSRVESTAEYVRRHARAGNVYVNRDMIGAVVGVQPFGGEGLSGTGPKAGGPFYVARFTTERVFSVNTAAVGGNATLLADTGEEDL
jgi:RHH-type proline utilization regulon transcriptional repressor/proline dehydrogenase/delta 1-pyrroline-5-carboxylate dehydrogenase